jgi:hypothetical protein
MAYSQSDGCGMVAGFFNFFKVWRIRRQQLGHQFNCVGRTSILLEYLLPDA